MFIELVQPLMGCVLVCRYTKERNINELRHNSIYGYENNRNSPVYQYTRTAPFDACYSHKTRNFIQLHAEKHRIKATCEMVNK